jgi:hypothetical protein
VTPSLSPVRLEAQRDQLRATLTVTTRLGEIAVVAHLALEGRIIDLQATGPGSAWHAGTTGDPTLDASVIATLEEAHAAASNAAAFVELDRRIRFRGKRPRW